MQSNNNNSLASDVIHTQKVNAFKYKLATILLSIICAILIAIIIL